MVADPLLMAVYNGLVAHTLLHRLVPLILERALREHVNSMIWRNFSGKEGSSIEITGQGGQSVSSMIPIQRRYGNRGEACVNKGLPSLLSDELPKSPTGQSQTSQGLCLA